MSANRSVQAAQRRRTGPTPDQNMPSRNPQPSINSAQLFANQARPGSGPHIPIGRLAGQQQQQQQQRQQQQPPRQPPGQTYGQTQSQETLNAVTKMTIPQAITLITLRLGALESKLLQMDGLEGGRGLEPEFLQSILSRLDNLENAPQPQPQLQPQPQPQQSQQQVDLIKQSLLQTKTATINLTKDVLAHKTQMENLRNEMEDLKRSMASFTDAILRTGLTDENENENENHEEEEEDNDVIEVSYYEEPITTTPVTSPVSDLAGIDLKQLVETELGK